MTALTIVALLGFWSVVSVLTGLMLGVALRRADRMAPALIPVHRRRFRRAG